MKVHHLLQYFLDREIGRHHGLEHCEHLVHVLVQNPEEDLLLGPEIIMQHGMGDTGPRGYGSGGGELVAFFEEKLLGRIEDGLLRGSMSA